MAYNPFSDRQPPMSGVGGAPASGGGSAGARNPFAGLLSGLGSMLGGGSGGGIGSSMGGFNALLDPSQRNIFGLVGRLTGAPTREEWLFQRAGQAQQKGISGLAERIQSGMPAPQAVMDFINSPEGMDFFTSVPNPADEIKRQLAVITQKPADPIVTSPGQQVLSPDASQVLHTTPTTETQTFRAMAEMSALPKEDIQRLAAGQLMGGGDKTQTERATASMVQSGMISPETALQINAGTLKVQPVLDPTGRTTGHVLVNIADGTVTQLENGTSRIQPQPGDPSYAPGVNDDGYDPYAMQDPGAYLAEFENPADIVEGVGMVPWMGENLGGLADTFLPGFSGAGSISAKRRRALNQIRNDARALKESGRYLASDLALLDSVLPSTGSSPTESATQAAESLIQYRLWLDQRSAFAQRVYNDPNATGDARGKALLELNDLQRASMNVPPVAALEAKIEELKTRSPAIVEGWRDMRGNIGRAMRGVEQLENEVLGVEPTSTPTESIFESEEAARKAIEANPEAYRGRSVRIGNRSFKVGVE